MECISHALADHMYKRVQTQMLQMFCRHLGFIVSTNSLGYGI